MTQSSKDSLTWFEAQKERLQVKDELWQRSTRVQRWMANVGLIGFFIFYLVFFGALISSMNPSLPVSEQNAQGYQTLVNFINSTWGQVVVVGLVASVLLLVVSGLMRRRPHPPRLTREEQCYLELFKAIQKMDYYNREHEDTARSVAKKHVRAVLYFLNADRAKVGDLEVARRELGVPFQALKRNIKTRLMPSITSNEPEVVGESIIALGALGRYFITPDISGLKDINLNLAKLPEQSSHHLLDLSSLRPHFIPFSAFALVGLAVFVAGLGLGVTRDTAFFAGVTITGALAGAYIVAEWRRD